MNRSLLVVKEVFQFSTLILTIVFTLTTICSFAQSDILYKIKSGLEFDPYSTGYINEIGDTIIPIGKYIQCYTGKFDKVAIVSIKDMAGFYAINRKEEILFQVVSYDNGPDFIKDGLFRIVVNNKIGYANMEGEIVINPNFDFALPFKDGYAIICIGGNEEHHDEYIGRSNGKWGVIDTSGSYKINPKYDDIKLLKEGKARVKSGDQWLTISIN